MMMNPFVRFVSRLAACAALSCVFAVGSSVQAGFITEALDVIEAATLGSPSSTDEDSPDITSYSLQSTGAVSTDGIVKFAELQLIGDTGHSAAFGASLFGAGLAGPTGAASKGASGSGGGGSGGGVGGYQFHASGGFFAGVLAPGSIGSQDSFTLEVGGSTSTLTGGSVATFGPGVTDFVVSGIDPAAGLLPTDPSPFNPILAGGGTVTVTPITSSSDVVIHNNPEPGSLTLLGLGVAGLFVWSRRRNKKQAA
jgi:hypothetical protein